MKIGPADPEILRLRANKSSVTQNWLPLKRPLRYWKKFRSIIYTQNAFVWCKIAKIGSGLRFAYDKKSVAMATYLVESEKLDLVKKIHANTFHLVKSSRKSVQ